MKIILLIAIIRLLMITNSPLMCASIYASIGMIFGLILGYPILGVLISALVSFALASLYFWLLDRTESLLMWWGILVGGIVIGLV